jgi:hypothetical protein
MIELSPLPGAELDRSEYADAARPALGVRRDLRLHLWEVEIGLGQVVEVVGKNVERDVRNDLGQLGACDAGGELRSDRYRRLDPFL